MATTPLPQAEVKLHYRGLASEYNDRANQTCKQKFHRIVSRHLAGHRRLLELGSGGSDLLDSLGGALAVASDLSHEMLRQRPAGSPSRRVVAVGEHLPFPDAHFDAMFSINVLEHVSDLGRVVAESARVLEPGGIWLGITPNGNWEFWLDLAERWKLKIPEGPHVFLTTRRLAEAVLPHFEVIEHRTLLMVPAGPPALGSLVDRLTACSSLGWGFFQYLVARKPISWVTGSETPRNGAGARAGDGIS